MIERGDWQVSEIARDAFDLEGKVVGTIGAGRIGYRVLQRLMPFDCKELLYFDYTPLPEHAAKTIKARRVEKLEDMLSQVAPLFNSIFPIANNLPSVMSLPSIVPYTKVQRDLSTGKL